MRSAVLVCVLAASTAAALHLKDNESPPADYSFAQYVEDFGTDKQYFAFAEASKRAATFAKNLELIRSHNSKESTWKAGVNEFTDWTVEEFKAKRTGTTTHTKGRHLPAHILDEFATSQQEVARSAEALPAAVDWRTKSPSVVTAPKNQGGCGSCWAFSATETLESAVAIATGKLLTLSPQQIVSCTPNPDDCGGTGGCSGATQQLGFNYTMGAGITLDTDYPYKGQTGTCDPSKVKAVAGIKGYVTVQPNNYTALATAVATQGPVSITVAAGGIGWQLYSSGVYGGGTFGKCGFSLDHGVQLVGYGTDGAKDYWWVRNSWGGSWGEKGYMRLRRYGEGKEPCGADKAPADGIACKGNTTVVTYCGECGIMSSSSYVTGAHLASQ